MSRFNSFIIGSIYFLLTISGYHLYGQRYPFTTIGVKDGLPQSSVFTIQQDPQGYIWMATESGLARFDGYNFTTYSIYNGIGAKYISDIKLDPQGNLWVSTMGKGISKFNGTSFNHFDKEAGLPSNQVRSLAFSGKNDLFISTFDVGIVRLSKYKAPQILTLPGGNFFTKTWKLNETRNGDIIVVGLDGGFLLERKNDFVPRKLCEADHILLNSCQLRNGEIFIGGQDQLTLITEKGIKNMNYLLDYVGGGPVYVWDIYESQDSSIYFSTSEGLIISKDSNVTVLNSSSGLPYDYIMETKEDRFGNFWVGTYGGGTAIIDSKGLDHFEYSEEKNALSTSSLCEDTEGNIWMGSPTVGSFIFDGSVVRHIKDDFLSKDFLNLATALNPVTKEIWVASMDGRIGKIKDDKLIWTWSPGPNEIISILYLSFMPDGTGIFSTLSGVYSMGVNDSRPQRIVEIPDIYIRSTFLDHEHHLWALGSEGQIFELVDEKKIIDHTKSINPNQFGLYQGTYDPFHQLYWFCSSSGLIVWNGVQNYVFHSANGLHSDSPWSITIDSSGGVWVGHEKGAEKIDLENKKITFLGYDQGFTPVETNSCAAMTDSKGDVWFGTITSSTRIKVDQLTPDFRTGVLRIQSVLANNEPKYVETYYDTILPKIDLSYKENNLRIKMVSLCYSNSNDVKYEWFLENHDDSWHLANDHREAVYPNLPPGRYKFHARAVDPNGYETSEVIIEILIRRPFWNRPWFYLLEFLVLGTIIFLSFKFSSNPTQNRLGSILTLLAILIIFETFIMYFSQYLNKFTGDIPIFQLIMNVILAATLHPLEHGIRKLMSRLTGKQKRTKQ